MKKNYNQDWQTGIAILEDNVFEKQILPENSPLAERRKDPRFSARVPLQYRLQQGSGGWRPVQTEDVSNTGIRIQIDHPAPATGTRVDLDVQLPGTKENLRIEGTIVWVRPCEKDPHKLECGIAFQNLRQITGKDKFLRFITEKLCLLAVKNAPKDLVSYPAKSLAELKTAYRLIYEEYTLRGYCRPNSSRMHYSMYCVLPESRTFILRRKGKLLGTITLITDSPCGMPMESLFHDEIEDLRKSGRRLAEVSLLALDHASFHKKSFSLTDFQKMTGTFALFKIMFDYARFKANATDLVIAVHPKHEDLYKYLGFTAMAEARLYPSACNKPALPLRLDIEQVVANLSQGLMKYFVEQTTPPQILEEYFRWDSKTLSDFVPPSSLLWQTLPDEYKAHFQTVYPGFNRNQ